MHQLCVNEPPLCDIELTNLMNGAIDTAYSKSFNLQLLSPNVTLFPRHSHCDLHFLAGLIIL